MINGDGSFSRDFTYIDNVIQMNLKAIVSDNEEALNNADSRTNLENKISFG